MLEKKIQPDFPIVEKPDNFLYRRINNVQGLRSNSKLKGGSSKDFKSYFRRIKILPGGSVPKASLRHSDRRKNKTQTRERPFMLFTTVYLPIYHFLRTKNSKAHCCYICFLCKKRPSMFRGSGVVPVAHLRGLSHWDLLHPMIQSQELPEHCQAALIH